MADRQVQQVEQNIASDPFADIEKEISAEGLFRLAVWFQSIGKIKKSIDTYTQALRPRLESEETEDRNIGKA